MCAFQDFFMHSGFWAGPIFHTHPHLQHPNPLPIKTGPSAARVCVCVSLPLHFAVVLQVLDTDLVEMWEQAQVLWVRVSIMTAQCYVLWPIRIEGDEFIHYIIYPLTCFEALEGLFVVSEIFALRFLGSWKSWCHVVCPHLSFIFLLLLKTQQNWPPLCDSELF